MMMAILYWKLNLSKSLYWLFYHQATYKVLKTVSMKIADFKDVMPYSLVHSYQRLEGT
jgi:hypothetical protein